MVELITPNGVVVSVHEHRVEHLLTVGYKKLDEKPETKRRAPRNTEKPDQK